MYELIEKQIVSKSGNPHECEDGLFLSENFAAVIDGVTSKGELYFGGQTGGCYAKNTLLGALKTLDAKVYAQQATLYLNNALKEAYPEEVYLKNDGKNKLQANIIIYSDFRNEIWVFGDCRCAINGKVFLHEKRLDTILSEMRALYLEIEMISGKSYDELLRNDTGREFIRPVLEKQSLLENRNSPYGFINLNGYDLDPERVIVYKLKKNDAVVLASDGYPVLRPTLEESENELALILKNDPLCCREYLSTKGLKTGAVSFDDRTYISFIVK